MEENKKTVTAVIPAYNREKTIRRCIDSVLMQTYPVSEIIVVDDGSDDGTIEILETEYKDSVKVIKQAHKGAQAARNAGIVAATSEYIAFLDSDDEWMREKTELQMQELDRKPDAVICGNGYLVQDSKKSIFRIRGYSGYVYKVALNNSFALFQGMIAKKDHFLKIGLLDEKTPSFQEWDTEIMLSKLYEFVFVDHPLFLYHMHDGETISKDKKRDIAGQEYLYHKYKHEIMEQFGIRGITQRYATLKDRCKRMKSRKYFKYLILHFLSKRGILLENL